MADSPDSPGNPFTSDWLRRGADERQRPPGTLSYVAGATDEPLRFITIGQLLEKAVARHGARDAAIFVGAGAGTSGSPGGGPGGSPGGGPSGGTDLRLSWYDLQIGRAHV